MVNYIKESVLSRSKCQLGPRPAPNDQMFFKAAENASAAIFLPGPQTFAAGPDSELFRNSQDGIGVGPAAIIGHDDPVLAFSAQTAFPPTIVEIFTDTVQGVIDGKQIYAAITVCIDIRDRSLRQ